jgi:ubiquinone/menaquinone biosynthesis C-methylase UbiE
MKTDDATALIAGAVPAQRGVWADVGAGDGTFTRALAARLGPAGRIYAIDRDASAVAALERWAATAPAQVIPVHADFTHPLELPEHTAPGLDGMLLANVIHYVPEPGLVLSRLVRLVRPGGRVVIVEYDGRAANRWVPYPIPSTRLPALAGAAGLSTPVVTGTRRSAFGGMLYVARADRVPD